MLYATMKWDFLGKRTKTQRWMAIAKRSKIVGMVSLATKDLTEYSHLSPAELKLKKQMLAAIEQKGVKTHKEADIVLPGFQRIVQETTDEREQGDMTLYTSENLKKRTALRRDPRVLAAMKSFWKIDGLTQRLDCHGESISRIQWFLILRPEHQASIAPPVGTIVTSIQSTASSKINTWV